MRTASPDRRVRLVSALAPIAARAGGRSKRGPARLRYVAGEARQLSIECVLYIFYRFTPYILD